MNKVMMGLALLLGLAAATPSFAQAPRSTAPQAASLGHGGFYVCPAGWTLVNAARYVTYYELQNQIQQQRQCVVFGPLGFCRQWTVVPVNVQVPVRVTRLVPANYCVYTGFVPGPYPYPFQ